MPDITETKTALTLTPEQWRAYKPTQTKAKADLSDREQRAYQTARKIAQQLRQQFSASRVVLFGSLVHKGWFTQWSDIDLAVWDISPERFYQAVSVATRMSSEFQVDLIDFHDCRPSIRRAIEHEGIEL